MNIRTILLGTLAALTMASTVQAGLIVNSIDMEFAGSTYSVTPGSTFGGALVEFSSAVANDPICAMSLDEFEGIGGNQLCGSWAMNTATAFRISGSNTGTTELQFGLDWGRGGFLALSQGGSLIALEQYTHDIWWARDWGNSDVLNFTLSTTGSFDLLLLGFEGCCNGENSARWRSGGGEWQTLSVVPVPSVLSLFALGITVLGLGRSRFRQSAV